MMTDTGQADQRARLPVKRELLLLFATFHLLYAATSPGDLMTDTQTRWLVAQRWLDTGWIDVEPGTVPLWAAGTDGRQYMVWSLGQSVLFVPFVLAGRAIDALPIPLPGSADLYGQFLACLGLFPALGAASLVVLYRIVIESGFSRRAARWLAVALGAGTMHWQHSVNSVDESQAALCILLTVWAVQRSWRLDAMRWPIVAGVATACGVWFRLPSFLFCGVILAAGAAFRCCPDGGATISWARHAARWAAAALAAAPLVALFAWFNFVRFGSPLETGYEQVMRDRLGVGMFDTPAWFGALGMLISPGKGVFVFNPVLLACIPGVWLLARARPRLAIIVLGVVAAGVALHSRHTTWAGDLTWGTRYLVSQLGVWTLALAPLVDRARPAAALRVLLYVSIALQGASVFYSYGLEFFQDRRHGMIPDGYIWRPAESQLVCRIRNLVLHAVGAPSYESTPPATPRPELHQLITTRDEVRRLHAVHFFPFKALAATGDRRLFLVLLPVWLAIVAGAAVSAAAWRRAVLISEPRA